MKLLVFLGVGLGLFVGSIAVHAAESSDFENRESATHRLRSAAVAGWSKIARKAIEEGADINSTDEYGNSPLFFAALRGHEKIVEMLLQAGADPEVKNDDWITPVFAAAMNCNDPVITLFVKRGINPNSKNRIRQTPIMRAAENGCHVVVQELLKSKRLNLNAKDDSGKDAEDYAREASILGMDSGDSLLVIKDYRGARKKTLKAPAKPTLNSRREFADRLKP